MRITDLRRIPVRSHPFYRHSRLKLFFQMALNRILKERLVLFFQRSFKRALRSVPSRLIQGLILGPLNRFDLDVIIEVIIITRDVSVKE